MKKYSTGSVIVGVMTLMGLFVCGLQEVRSQEAAKSEIAAFEVESRHVDIWSDGTRISGDLWYLKGLQPGDKLPAVILCHGWGGVRSHFNQAYAPEFATAGYVVLTFDYRGWGDSDSRLVIKEKMPEPNESGMITVRAQAIRELVDPFDQTEDIIHCIDYLSGEPAVDPSRIGLWGTSFGGGHVVYVAALDKRVKCIVSQVPSMDGGWVNLYYQPSKLATQRARGEIDPVPQGINKIGRLKGTPFLSRIAKYHPVEFANHLKIPVLIIVAEREELMDNRLHGERVYNLVKGNVPAKYEVFSGTHFEIYGKGRMQSIKMALEWFDKHL
jgi:dienelactone hydrolase